MNLEHSLFHIISKEMDWLGHPLTLEVGRMARRADGAVTVRYRDTVILCTVCAKEAAFPGAFLPLSVHYQEKSFSAGRIPGGFVKREGKPSDYESLVSRYIDRMLRPMFPKHFYHEVQVVCTVLSYDERTDPGMLSMIGASAAVAVSGLPICSTAAGIRVGYAEGEFSLQHSACEAFDLLMTGTPQGPSMIELQAKECSESFVLEGLNFGYQALLPLIALIESLKTAVNPKLFLGEEHYHHAIKLPEEIQAALRQACTIIDGDMRTEQLKHVFKTWRHAYATELHAIDSGTLEAQFYSVWREIARDYIIAHKKRLDGRDIEEIRPIMCEVGILPRCHGSALFTRGQTQALVAATLGSRQDDSQLVERISGTKREHFMLHYNFPPYSVGEVGRLGAPGRREIGHGRLALKALIGLLPDELSCTVRLVSEITESYGSSSMATVCAASLALMDAGIALSAPVAGIAMGLISDASAENVVLSDISGTEDFLGDMDFKVAGSAQGITALQVDLKVSSLTMQTIEKTLEQAKLGRMHILSIMEKQSLSKARENVSVHAPRVSHIRIPTDKIRDLVGPGGKNIKQLCDASQSKIDISEDGSVTIFSYRAEDAEHALQAIRRLTQAPIPGNVYEGVVKKLMDFGAFVDIGFGQDGLVHVTEVVSGKRLGHPSECLKEGQSVKVRVLGVEKGKVQLSIRQV